jgi:signal transduction histidine kinase
MRTIYSKLLLVSISVLVAGFTLLTTGLNVAYKTYIITQNETEMIRLASDFNDLLNEKYKLGELSSLVIRDEIYRLERYANVKIWMIPKGGEMVVTDESADIDLIHRELDLKEIESVFEEGIPIFRAANYKYLPENQYYTLIYPIEIGEKTVFVVYLNKSVPFINKTVEDINRFAMVTLILAAIYASITLFYAAKRVSDDIKRLNEGVKFVAKGNFDYAFETTRSDEIGELCKNFNQLTTELKEMEDARRKFISDLSHDLRSPITSIKGYTLGILDGTIAPEKWEKYLNIVKDEADRLTKLINDILDLSKMQTGELDLNRSDFDMHELLLNILDRFEARMTEKDVEVSLKLASGDVMVEGDYALIERVIYNLVDNAVKFVAQDGTLEILTDVKETKILIGIRNTGVTIPEDKLSHIWQRFSKGDLSRGLEKRSSGLGLSIVKEILDAHGEKIDVYSNDFLGVMFVFSMSRSTFTKRQSTKK